MSVLKFGGAGARSKEIDNTAPAKRSPVGVPAGVIGTAMRGPAFVPVTVSSREELFATFGQTDGEKHGVLAAHEWLRNASALTYMRVLGAGQGLQRTTSTNAGTVTGAGFVVGENQPSGSAGELSANPYANLGSSPGRTAFLGCFMSESAGSTLFSDAGLQGAGSVTPGASTSVPILRGVLFAASGVVPRLSSSAEGSNGAPLVDLIATAATATGSAVGSVTLLDGSVSKQEFVLLLNGHKGTDPLYPRVLTASFDMTAPNYFANVLNSDPLKLQVAGHCLYAHWDIHPSQAVVTGSGLITTTSGAFGASPARSGAESAAFLLTASLGRNVGSSTVPNYENFEDRFTHASTPWITSQAIGGTPVNLFRLVSLSGGASATPLCKVMIENISLSTDPMNAYCSFDVVLRAWDDRDSEPRALEQFRGLSLDPTSDRYISRVIGDKNKFFDFDSAETDQRIVVEGSYDGLSNLVRVEVSQAVSEATVSPSAVPFGFRGAPHLVTSGSAPMQDVTSTQLSVSTALKRAVQPPVPYRTSISVGASPRSVADASLCWGVQFEHVTDLSNVNGSLLRNDSLLSHAKHFPTHMTSNMNFAVGSESVGLIDTDANGVIDSDRFCKNGFSMSNVRVVTSSNGLADPERWASAAYVRRGGISADDSAKTRALTASDITNANKRFVKFVTMMQGGFSGVNAFDADESKLTDDAVRADVASTLRGGSSGPTAKAYTKALSIFKNTLESDVQLLAVPGIRQPTITDAAIAAVEDRVDAMLLLDVVKYDADDAVMRADSTGAPSPLMTAQEFSARALDSSFAAAYFPDVVMTDPTTKTNVTAPATVAALSAIALNDSVGRPWLAPAGLQRGSVQSAVEPSVTLSQQQIDLLYDSSINPIVSFPSPESGGIARRSGVTVWGQKTLLRRSSALDRVNVRRLLIAVRRIVRRAVMSILFEPNRESTLAKFTSQVTPQLDRIQKERGLAGFRVIVDSSTTTREDVENNTVRGKILLAPVKSVEFVSLDFAINNAGASVN